MNSGNANATCGYANPEPSRGYILGRCRDYWRGLAPLITSKSVLPRKSEEIVHAFTKVLGSVRFGHVGWYGVFLFDSINTANQVDGQVASSVGTN